MTRASLKRRSDISESTKADIMTMFKDKSELEHYLRGINPNYDRYAEVLWRNQVTSASQLGDASVSTLLACGIESALHAENIIARSKAVGTGAQEVSIEIRNALQALPDLLRFMRLVLRGLANWITEGHGLPAA
ncbi:hypothetical protein WJX77_000736 [Trebouxia sp. C0004]